MRDNVKSLTEIKIDDNNCSYLIHRHSLSIAEGHQISQAPFVLGGNLLAISIPVIYKPWHSFQEELFRDLTSYKGEADWSVVPGSFFFVLFKYQCDISPFSSHR